MPAPRLPRALAVALALAGGPAWAAPAPPAAPACADAGAGPEPDGPGLQAIVKRRQAGIHACYAKALKRDPKLAGRFLVAFEVDRCGRIGAVRIANVPRSTGFAACVAQELRAARTPFRPAEPVRVEYPLTLSAP